MEFFIFCKDKPDHAHVRAENRPAHLDYVAGFNDKLIAGGPTLTDDGAGMNGSVILIDLEDRAAIDAFLAGDPYGKAGLFEEVIVRPFKKVLPK